MSAPSASGTYREALEAARALLAASSTFQGLVGADDATEALAIIDRDQVGHTGSAIGLPSVRVMHSAYSREAVANSTWLAGGTVQIVMRVAPHASYTTPEDGEAWMLNVLGGIIDDMASAVVTSGTLLVRTFRAQLPQRQERGSTEYWRGVIELEYGAGV